MNNEEIKQLIEKLDMAKMDVNSIPIAGYNNCVKVVKSVTLIEEVQQYLLEHMEQEKEDTEHADK
jgi:hypothetical protein